MLTAIVALAGVLIPAGCGDSADDSGPQSQQPAARKAASKLNGADKPKAADFPRVAGGQSLQEVADGLDTSTTQAALAGSVYTPGHNRIAFGLINKANRFLYAPTAIYVARRPEDPAIGPILAPADVLVTEPAFRSQQAATEKDPFAAVYQAIAEMDKPGQWTVLVVSKVGGRLMGAPLVIPVKRRSSVPAIGSRAPVVDTDTVASAGSIKAIDTRIPNDDMHSVNYRDVRGKKPVALLFATPQLCQSKVCGPVVDIAAQLKQRYGDRVTFIHQEVYRDNDVSKGLRKPMRRFGLPTEPWLFAIDRNGRVASRLEGSFGLTAFEKSVQAAIAGVPRR